MVEHIQSRKKRKKKPLNLEFYLEKKSFKNKDEINVFLDKWKLRECITSTPVF